MSDDRKRLWIDGHVHLLRNSLDGEPLDYTAEDVLAVLAHSDADLRFVCNDTNPTDIARIAGDPDYLHAMNERVYAGFVQRAQGRLFGSVTVDPRALKQSHEDLDLYVGERGFVQVGEIEGRPFGFDLDSAEMLELARHAAMLGAPLQLHCSTNDDPTGEHMRQALHVAAQVPEAQVIIAHAIGGRNSYQYILAAETYLAHGGDNLYLEIYAFNVRAYLREAYEHLGPERLLVGTDWATYHAPPFAPYATEITLQRHPDWWRSANVQGYGKWKSELWLTSQLALDLRESPYPCAVATYVGFLREAGVTEEDIEKVGSGNAIRLFRLKEKGLV